MSQTEIIILVACVLSAVASVLSSVLVVVKGKRNKGNPCQSSSEDLRQGITLGVQVTQEEGAKTRDSVNNYLQGAVGSIFNGIQATNTQVLETVRAMNDGACRRTDDIRAEVRRSLETTQNGLNENMRALKAELQAGLAENRTALAAGIKEIRDETGIKLNEIRGVVDEKLTVTINTRLKESFEQVSKQLESVNKGLGEMQSLSSGMSDLKKVLSGVKSRGNWGEVSLEDLLSDILAPNQFKRQFAIGQEGNANRKVDFAIVLPGLNDGEEVYLPVDSKFPLEDFAAMQEAGEIGDATAFGTAKSALRDRIKRFASDISNKYIQVPKTTDFAIMYLPIESLYAEVLRMDGLQEELQEKYRIIPAGPTNFTALLNSLKMGFKTVQIQKYSNEMVKMLRVFNKDFGKFVENLSLAQKQVDTVQKTLRSATERSEAIQNKLNKVETLGITDGGAEETPPLPTDYIHI